MTTRDAHRLHVVPDAVEFRDNAVLDDEVLGDAALDDSAPGTVLAAELRSHPAAGDPAADAQLSDRWRDLAERAAQLDAAVAAERSRATGAWPLVVLGAALTVVLALLGSQPWQLPVRAGSAVAEVPQSLLTFLLLCAAGCVWTAGRAVRPAQLLGSAVAVRLWWLLLAGAAVVSVTATLSLASYAGTGARPGELLARCAVPVVPALLAGVLARAEGRTARLRAALGTGLVTVPLLGLGWSLLASASAADLSDVLGMTLLAGVAPLALTVAFVAGRTAR